MAGIHKLEGVWRQLTDGELIQFARADSEQLTPLERELIERLSVASAVSEAFDMDEEYAKEAGDVYVWADNYGIDTEARFEAASKALDFCELIEEHYLEDLIDIQKRSRNEHTKDVLRGLIHDFKEAYKP